eukprot:2341380-Amphidinium_carterae.1
MASVAKHSMRFASAAKSMSAFSAAVHCFVNGRLPGCGWYAATIAGGPSFVKFLKPAAARAVAKRAGLFIAAALIHTTPDAK